MVASQRIVGVIADDEPLLRAQLRARLARVWPELDVVHEMENGRDILQVLEEHQPQVVFLDIHRVRMGSRLAFDIEVPEPLKCRAFPPMMLISLVENAVKHGVDPCCDQGRIVIRAAEAEGRLTVSVADTGEGVKPKKGGGVGLTNIRERLKALYGGSARLVLQENAPHGVVASIEVPPAA